MTISGRGPSAGPVDSPRRRQNPKPVRLPRVVEIQSSTELLAAAIGRKLPFKIAVFNLIECPVSVKADVQPGTLKFTSPSVRFTLDSRH